MTRDLRGYRAEGYIGDVLADSLRQPDPIHYVAIELGDRRGCSRTSFFSRGDFRPDIVECAETLSSMYGDRYHERLPAGWRERVLASTQPRLRIAGGKNTVLSAGALDFKRLAQMAQGTFVKDAPRDAHGNRLLKREQFLQEYPGDLVDQLINGAKYGTPSAMMLPPGNEALARMVQEAGEVFDHYQHFPQGALMMNKDWSGHFAYVLGRKHSPPGTIAAGSRGSRYTLEEGSCLEIADPSVYVSIDRDCAPHMIENPVLRLSLNFPMAVVRGTSTINPEEERAQLERILDELSYKGTWVQGMPGAVRQAYPNEMGPWTREGILDAIGKTLDGSS